jgi:hypothetical protein
VEIVVLHRNIFAAVISGQQEAAKKISTYKPQKPCSVLKQTWKRPGIIKKDNM